MGHTKQKQNAWENLNKSNNDVTTDVFVRLRQHSDLTINGLLGISVMTNRRLLHLERLTESVKLTRKKNPFYYFNNA